MSNAGGTDSSNNEDVEIEIEEGRLVCVHPNCAKKKHDYSLLTIQEHVAQHVLTDAPEREVSKKHFNLQCSSCSPAIHFVSFQHAYDHHMRLPSHRITPTNNVDWESRVEDKSVVESFRRYQDYQKLYIRVSHTKKSKFKLRGAPMPVSRGSAQSHVNVDTPGVAPKTGNRTRQEAVGGGPMGDVPATANMNHIRSGQPQQERVTRAAKTVQDGSDTRQAGVGTVASGASTTPNSSEKRRFKVVDIDTPVETKRRTTRTIRDSSRMGGLMMDEDELRAAARAETSCRSPNPFGARSPCEWGGGNRTPGDVRTPTYSYSSAPWVDGSRPDRSRSPAYGGNRTPDRRQEYSFGPRQPRTPVYGEEEATLNKRDNNWSHAPPPPPRPAGTGLYGTASNMAVPNDSSTMRGNGQEPSRQDHVQVKKDAGFSSGADCPGTSFGQARQTTSRLPSFAQAKRAPPHRDQVQQQPTTATTSGWAGFGLPTSTAAASSAARSSHGGPVFAQTPVAAAAPVAVPPPPPQLPTPARARSPANTEVVSKASKHERRKTQMVENYMPRKPAEQPKPPPLRSPAAHRSRTPVPRGRSPARSRSPPARYSRDKKKRRRTPSSSEESEDNRRSRRSRRR